MKIAFTALVLVMALGVQAFHFTGRTIVLKYDKALMQTYKYVTDREYIVEDNYVAYHFYLDEHVKVILKVINNESVTTVPQSPTDVVRMDVQAFRENVDIKLVADVNLDLANLFIEKREGSTSRYYRVRQVTLIDDEPTYLNYFAYPYMMMHLDYGNPFGHAEELYAPFGEYETGAETRMYYYGASEEAGHEKYTFFKVYRDACHGRPFGMLTPRTEMGEYNPYTLETPLTDNKIIYRSCQHAIIIDYMPGIGILREYYSENNNTYFSLLESVDDVPIDDYIEKFDGHVDESILPVERVTTPSGMDSKGMPVNYSDEVSPRTPPRSHVSGFGKLSGIKKGTFSTPPPAKSSGSAAPAPPRPNAAMSEGASVHTVKEGDTLYNISRRYGTSVQKIQEANNLSSDLILLNQTLVIPK